MSALNDLIGRIQDEDLRDRIQEEVDRLNKQKKFGLVFEEHLPECTILYEVPVKKGANVTLRGNKAIEEIFTVKSITNDIALCESLNELHQAKEIPVRDLVVVAQFGEPIYPYLKPIDSICNAPDSDLWHTLIEADNYHALQLLEYLYAGKVDCIYIDPPYNTGARDWKYNNDYVDGNDSYRHSKWLSMMEKRLRLSKILLNPKDSVLIITIDENEYHHLACLIEDLFPNARTQMVSTIINPKGTPGVNLFTRMDEYIFFIHLGGSCPEKLSLADDFRINASDNRVKKLIRWQGLAKTQYSREGHPETFYPIYLNSECTHIVDIGDPIGRGVDRHSIPDRDGCITVWPINKSSGAEAQWSISAPKLRNNLSKGYVRVAKGSTSGIYYLTSGVIEQIESGEFKILGRNADGSIIIDESDYEYKFVPGTAWKITSHDATRYGSDLLRKFLPDRTFPFPKSLYAVHDTIRFYVNNKPNALILDFFAGSGTTLHAVNLLNAEDGGKRRCIMVTNNEVSEKEAKELASKGFLPGDNEWEKLGIARYITWPRTRCSILGKDINGKTLSGDYISSIDNFHMSDGFCSNAAFFKLSFLDKNSIALGRQFKELLPTLWMKAGAFGRCPSLNGQYCIPEYIIFAENKFAVISNAKSFSKFKKELAGIPDLDTIFIVTDSDDGFQEMASELNIRNTYQLYRDYLDNFRINRTR